jgi:hypothetical protein
MAASPHIDISNTYSPGSNHSSGMRMDHSTRVIFDEKSELARRNAYHQTQNLHQHHQQLARRDPFALSMEMQRKIAEDSEKVLRMQTEKILQDNQQRQLNQGMGMGGSLPSLLSTLGSVGPPGAIDGSNRLQGLAGLSSVLQGGGSSIPSLSSMYASLGPNSASTHTVAPGHTGGAMLTPHANPHSQAPSGQQMPHYSQPNLLGGGQPQQQPPQQQQLQPQHHLLPQQQQQPQQQYNYQQQPQQQPQQQYHYQQLPHQQNPHQQQQRQF